MLWLSRPEPQKYPLPIENGRNFTIKKILEIGKDTFVIAGNIKNRKGDDTRIRLIGLTYQDLLAKKKLNFAAAAEC